MELQCIRGPFMTKQRDVINPACHFHAEQKHYKHETTHQQLTFACNKLQMSQICSTTLPTLSTNGAHIRLISYWTKAYSSYILHLHMPHVHCGLYYVSLKAASDLTSGPCDCERPIDAEPQPREPNNRCL